jgi:hypothetical protein
VPVAKSSDALVAFPGRAPQSHGELHDADPLELRLGPTRLSQQRRRVPLGRQGERDQ